MFLKIEDIKGGVPDAPYKDWSYAGSFQNAISRPVPPRRIGSTSPQFSEMTVTKLFDASSPYLFREATTGSKGKEVKLELVRSSADRERYYHIKLSDAFISGYNISSGGDQPMESISFNYARIELTFIDYSKAPSIKETTAWYDLRQATGGIQSSNPPNTAPTIAPIAGQTTQAGVAVTVPFTVNDAQTPAANLIVTATSGNLTLVPNANLTLGGSGANRTVTIQPVAGQFGQGNITLTVSDGTLTGTRSFPLVVENPNVNEPPLIILSDSSVIQAIAGRDTPVARLQTMDPETNQLSLTLEVTSGTLRAVASAGVTTSGNDSSRLVLSGLPSALNALLTSPTGLVYRATSGASGTDIITAALSDGNQSTSTTLGIRIYRTQYEQWLHQHFSEAQLNNPSLEASVWGPHADADGDRLENVAEYGLGRNVAVYDPITVNMDPRMSLIIMRRQDPALRLEVEIASDLDPNSWSSDPTVLETFPPVNLGNGFDQVRFLDREPATPSAKRFMRARWTLDP